MTSSDFKCVVCGVVVVHINGSRRQGSLKIRYDLSNGYGFIVARDEHCYTFFHQGYFQMLKVI